MDTGSFTRRRATHSGGYVCIRWALLRSHRPLEVELRGVRLADTEPGAPRDGERPRVLRVDGQRRGVERRALSEVPNRVPVGGTCQRLRVARGFVGVVQVGDDVDVVDRVLPKGYPPGALRGRPSHKPIGRPFSE